MDLENEIHFNPWAVLQHQPRSDPPLWRRGCRHPSPERYRCGSRRHGLYPRRISRGPVRGQRRSAGFPQHRKRRHHLEYLAELLGARRHVAGFGATRFMDNDQANTQPLIPAECHRRFQAQRRISKLVLVAQREQSASTRCITTTRSRAPSPTAVQRLSPAGPNLHGEGRRDLLTPEGWRGALCRTALARIERYSPGVAWENTGRRMKPPFHPKPEIPRSPFTMKADSAQ